MSFGFNYPYVIVNVDVLEDYDGNVYSTVIINGQEWTVGNLKTTHFSDGTAIPNITDGGLWAADTAGAYCWYNNDIGNKNTYGALYNWWCMPTYHAKELCYFKRNGVYESGWKIPTTDWDELGTYLSSLCGTLKEIGTAHWTTPNTGATNLYGFTAVPAGTRDYSTGAFSQIGTNCTFWVDSSFDLDQGFGYSFAYNSNSMSYLNPYKPQGCSVRCVRTI